MKEVTKSETAKREEATLAFWKEHKIFEKSLRKDAPKGEYVFYDGPPFATGLPHYGHLVASVIKDVVPRYWTMQGYRVPRVWGWDCHGLPIENIVEKELGFKHKKEIKEYGIAKFNEFCRNRVLTYAHEWEKIIPRIGRWADMEHAYRTMDKPFMESVWWVFKQLYDKGLVYEDYRSMHICPRCETTLSQQEVAEGYKDVKDISVTVKFRVKNPEKHNLPENTYFLAWTTTPWTLPGNVALAVGKDITYALISVAPAEYSNILKNVGMSSNTGERYIVALERVPQEFKVEREIKGGALVGLEYEPLFDYYAGDTTLKDRENGWKVYAGDFVNTEDGTGIVHIAPAFGTDDWELAKKEQLPFVQHVAMDGTMKPEVKDFAGKSVIPRAKDNPEEVREIDLDIRKFLGDKVFNSEKVPHSYPHCWRCDTALLNYATSSWFVSVTKLKDDLLKNAKNINWSPAHIKDGRFGDWLLGARDWSISRQRFWASVIPIWKCEKCKKLKVFGSASELEEASGKKVNDLHKHIVDEITVPCECLPAEASAKAGSGIMRRVPDVLDTWFDSGSMPYGERHYPFENMEKFNKVFPAQFIAEGLDQTRAWFYYLHVLAGALFKKNSFQNVIVNGIVLAEDGKKMSKKLNNYPDPMEVVGKYGADALRFYLLSSPVMQAENLSFSEKGVDEVARKNIGRLGNVLAFYQMYADDTKRGTASIHVLDRWILARLDRLVRESTRGFEKYQLDTATRPIISFIDDLSTWYLRRSRDRISAKGRSQPKADQPLAGAKTSGGKEDSKAALATLRHVLYTLSLVAAPSMPFLAEHLFQAVKEGNDPESVHLSEWPSSSRAGFLTGLFGKKEGGILKAMADARSIVTQALEARDKAGIKVRQPLQKLTVNSKQLTGKNRGELFRLIKDEVNVKEIEIGGLFALDTNITSELREEGAVRDAVRLVQDARKAAKMRPGEHGRVSITVPQEDRLVIERHLEAIGKQTNTTISLL